MDLEETPKMWTTVGGVRVRRAHGGRFELSVRGAGALKVAW